MNFCLGHPISPNNHSYIHYLPTPNHYSPYKAPKPREAASGTASSSSAFASEQENFSNILISYSVLDSLSYLFHYFAFFHFSTTNFYLFWDSVPPACLMGKNSTPMVKVKIFVSAFFWLNVFPFSLVFKKNLFMRVQEMLSMFFYPLNTATSRSLLRPAYSLIGRSRH